MKGRGGKNRVQSIWLQATEPSSISSMAIATLFLMDTVTNKRRARKDPLNTRMKNQVPRLSR